MVVLGINRPFFNHAGIKFINVGILDQVDSNTIIVKPTKRNVTRDMNIPCNKILDIDNKVKR